MGDTVPDMVLELTDTVPDTVPDTVSDTAMVDTVERDPLMPGTDAVTVMVVMVDTAVDTEVTDTAVDTDTDVDTDTRFLSNQLTKNHFIQNYAIVTAEASEHNFYQKQVSNFY